mmetsp:Transcript_155251/g.476886  ORF Transcript_155251/g.476886 Transcript_155251/m.476886 type:complete len:279 (-) Transcript_155251:47-883(-)
MARTRMGSCAWLLWATRALGCWGVEGTHLLDGIVDGLAAVYTDTPRAAIESAVAEAWSTVLSAEGVPAHEFRCDRDYSAPCPQGWADVGDAGNCSAPLGYSGACPALVSYGQLTPLEKQRRAAACGTEFACLGAGSPDYEAGCPRGWAQRDGECVAPGTYMGPCVGRKSFAGMTYAQKRAWGIACRVDWPPRATVARGLAAVGRIGRPLNPDCVPDYGKSCPDLWHPTPGGCRAPTEYQGPCARTIRSHAFTHRQRKVFAEACQAPWPCTEMSGPPFR